jgi:hypothetical protein
MINGRELPKTTVSKTITTSGATTGSLFVSEQIEDLRGQTLLSRSPDANGDNQPEVMTYTYDPATRSQSSIGADGIKRISTRYADM